MSVLQTVQKNNKRFTYGQTVQKTALEHLQCSRQCKKIKNKKNNTPTAIYIWTDSAKKTTNNLHMDRQCKKNNRQFTYGQTVQKNNKQFTYGQTVQKKQKKTNKQQTIYIWTDSAKKTTHNLHMDRQCKKTALEHLQCSRQCKKNNSNLHMDSTYLQTVQKTMCKYTYIYSVRLVYYKDILNYQRHIIHRMGTSTLCTVSIHNVVYT